MYKPGEMLEVMIDLAVKGHAGQMDKGGRPYILHPLAVMHMLKTDDEELECIAVGHDLIEDTKTTYQTLHNFRFTERIINGIDALTKRRGETLEEYKARVKMNKDAILVKMADLRHNSDIRRLKGVEPADILRMISYHNFWLELKNELEFVEATRFMPSA